MVKKNHKQIGFAFILIGILIALVVIITPTKDVLTQTSQFLNQKFGGGNDSEDLIIDKPALVTYNDQILPAMIRGVWYTVWGDGTRITDDPDGFNLEGSSLWSTTYGPWSREQNSGEGTITGADECRGTSVLEGVALNNLKITVGKRTFDHSSKPFFLNVEVDCSLIGKSCFAGACVSGQMCGNNIQEGTEECDGNAHLDCRGLCTPPGEKAQCFCEKENFTTTRVPGGYLSMYGITPSDDGAFLFSGGNYGTVDVFAVDSDRNARWSRVIDMSSRSSNTKGGYAIAHNKLYVTAGGPAGTPEFRDNKVLVVDLRTQTFLKEIWLGFGESSDKGEAVYLPSSDRVYAAREGTTTIAIIDPNSDVIAGVIPVGTRFNHLALSRNGATLYAVRSRRNTSDREELVVIDTATNQITKRTKITNGGESIIPSQVATDPSGFVYISYAEGSIGKIAKYNSAGDLLTIFDLSPNDLGASIDERGRYLATGRGVYDLRDMRKLYDIIQPGASYFVKFWQNELYSSNSGERAMWQIKGFFNP